MSQALSIPSTGLLDGYSVGAFPIDFTQRWNRLSWASFTAETITIKGLEYPGNYIGWQCNLPSITVTHIFGSREPFSNFAAWPQPRQLRLKSHVILDAMPDEGFEEAYSALQDIYTFYIGRSDDLPERPQRQEVVSTYGGAIDRGPLYLGED